MKVKVLYFAQAREAAGKKSETIVLDRAATAGELFNTLAASNRAIARIKSSVRLAVNKEIVAPDTQLKDGDELGILPPVAGG